MNISEFAKPVTAKTLNESLAKRFGKRIALESFTLAQLHDARNKLRTRLSQIEVSESFSAVVESDEYQKSKLFLDVLNAEISERGDIEEEAIEEKAKPDYIDLDGDGDKKEPMKKAAKDKKEKAKESVVREGAEDQAEIVMAAKDMVDRVTGWMEDTAEMKTESMLDLADAIRDEMGVDQSNQYVETIKASLDELYTSMESTRAALSSGVSMLTGEGEMMPPMGAEDPDAAMEPTIDMDDAEGVVPPADDEFAAAPAAAGGEEPAGRETRESVELDEFGGMDSNDPADLNLQKKIQNKFGSGPKQDIKGAQYWTFDKDGNKVPAEVMLNDPAVKMMIDAGVLKLNPQALAKLKAMRGDRRTAPRESVDPRKLAQKLSKKK
tara:strand:- start:2540 stop:3679 length:1140 start_codon:yes stop_codon:yes gene_type:complete